MLPPYTPELSPIEYAWVCMILENLNDICEVIALIHENLLSEDVRERAPGKILVITNIYVLFRDHLGQSVDTFEAFSCPFTSMLVEKSFTG